MSIKDNALLVSLSVNKPQMTQKDAKATTDAEVANNAHGAGHYRKDLYPRTLVQPILSVESAARAYIETTTYPWSRGEDLLPTTRFMTFAERMGKYELEFNQCVTAFLNNWSNVMQRAQDAQGALFDPSAYPDLTNLKSQFRFRVSYRPVTDIADFRVQMQQEDLDVLRAEVERSTVESFNGLLRAPLQRLREVVGRLHEVTGKDNRVVVNKRTGTTEARPPIFRDSLVHNITDEIALLRDFAEALPENVTQLANEVCDMLPQPETLRNDPNKRQVVNTQAAALLSAIDSMLED